MHTSQSLPFSAGIIYMSPSAVKHNPRMSKLFQLEFCSVANHLQSHHACFQLHWCVEYQRLPVSGYSKAYSVPLSETTFPILSMKRGKSAKSRQTRIIINCDNY